MKLLRFRVTGFRSVEDSGWLEAGDITALSGENGWGRTNALLPLWKLNPAGDQGKIDPLADYPRARHNEIRALDPKPKFIEAEFELPDALAAAIAKEAMTTPEQVKVASVSRRFDEKYTIGFPKGIGVEAIDAATVNKELDSMTAELNGLKLENEIHIALRQQALKAISDEASALAARGEGAIVTLDQLRDVQQRLEKALAGDVGTTSPLAQVQRTLGARFEPLTKRATKRHPSEFEAARKLVLGGLPKFVYYSNYGNLDSEIYLPQVIQNLERLRRNEIRGREAAKARTLKVLFDFVKLKATEILELGRDRQPGNLRPDAPPITDAEIEAVARRKREREILLMSASTDLTKRFKDWWKRGNYVFRFDADGEFFRIWVKDDIRPEEIELEGRSSGLQWFFSFFIVFQAERGDEHRDAILLLDEPGVTLHPLAQEDLFRFFAGLSASNQLLYTSHSQHLIDPDRLSDVRVVSVSDSGVTMVSANLRAPEGDARRRKSIFAVDAALGLSVSRTMLLYAQPTIVEGPADQLYLSYVKTRLIGEKIIAPARELIFVPAYGARAVSTTASIVGAPDELPPVLLDGDPPGVQAKEQLGKALYAKANDRIFIIDSYTGLKQSEIEDLFPPKVLVDVASRLYRTENEEFGDAYVGGTPIVPQIKAFAQKIGLELDQAWKIRLAHSVIGRLRRQPGLIDGTTLDAWKRLFEDILRVQGVSTTLTI